MVTKIDRTGEIGYNNFGSEMIIVRYENKRNIDVYFSEYNWTFKSAKYDSFKKGNIKCPYERRTYGVGYLGEGEYKCKENDKLTRVYRTWVNMLTRCYNLKYHEKRPTYINCEVSKEFHNFQDFGNWYDDNYYQIEGQRMCLDKDILFKHNKIYSSETCMFVPNTINVLFTKSDSKRGESVIGISPFQGKYRAECQMINSKTGKSKKRIFRLI